MKQINKKYLMTTIVVICISGLIGIAYATDRLIVKDGSGVASFSVQDTGLTDVSFSGDSIYNRQTVLTLSSHNTDTALRSDVAMTMTNAKTGKSWLFTTQLEGDGFAFTKDNTGGKELVVSNATTDAINTTLALGSGATCDATGHWADASSREYKENIQTISSSEAFATLQGLDPVKYSYKRDASQKINTGFIAEDVPELVASPDRKTINSTKIVAILAKVIQEQQKSLDALSKKVQELEKQLNSVSAQLSPSGQYRKDVMLDHKMLPKTTHNEG